MFQSLKRKWFGDYLPEGNGEQTRAGQVGSGANFGDNDLVGASCSSSSKVQVMGNQSVGTQVDSEESGRELVALKAELSSLHEAVMSNICCFKCGRLPRSLPITSCDKHHRLCDGCTSSLYGASANQCSTCSSPLTLDNSPLLASLLQCVRRPCQWSSTGCEYSSTSLQELELHEAVCWCQPVLCWGCNTSTPLNHFDQHSPNLLCLSHRKVHYESAEAEMLLRQEDDKVDVDWKPVGIKFCGKMFYLRISRRRQLGYWTFHVAAQLLPRNCGRFLAKIKVSKPSAEQPSRSCVGPPSSLVKTLDQVVCAGGALVIPNHDMQKLLEPSKEGSLFKFSVDMGLLKD